jgi:hypothetical protein
MFFVLIYLIGKFEVRRGADPFAMIICITLAWIGLTTCLENVSGGVCNPAIALA